MRRWLSFSLLWLCACTFQPDLPDIPERRELPASFSVDAKYEDVLAEPGDSEVNGALGMALHRLDDAGHAAIFYQRALLLSPGTFRWRYLRGVAEAAQGHYDTAAATLRYALRKKPGYVPARLRLAEILLRMGNYDGSEIITQGLIKERESVALAYFWLGRAEESTERLGEASKAFRKSCEADERFGAAHWRLARCALQLGRQGEAEEHFILAERNRFQHPAISDPLLEGARDGALSATDQVEAGYHLETEGKFEQARRAYQKALRMDPGSDTAHARLVSTLRALGERAGAAEQFQAAKRLNPDQDDAYAGYGGLMVDMKRYQEARAAFGQALRINPVHPEALHHLATMLAGNREYKEAERLYRLALKSRPDYREALVALGSVLVAERRYGEAFEQFDKVLDVEDEKTPALLYEMSSYYLKAGQRDKAWGMVRAAHELARKYHQASLLDRIEREQRR